MPIYNPASGLDVPFYNVVEYGADPTGVNDSTTAINKAISEAQAAGGGTVFFPPGTYLALGAITPVYTGPSSAPIQAPIRLTGATATANGYWATPLAQASVLDLRYDGSGSAVAKIDTRGAGVLEVDHLTLKSGGTDNYKFFQTTNTMIRVHDNAIIGNVANSGTACVQDFLYLGGQTAAVGDGSDDGFQGYGSRIWDNFYSNIRRGITWGVYANGVAVEHETYSGTCGSSEAQGAPYVFTVPSGQNISGNRIRGGVIEITNYLYAANLAGGVEGCLFDGIGIYDQNGYTLGYIYFGSATTTYDNLVIPGWIPAPLQGSALAGPGASSNTLLSALGSAGAFMPHGIIASGENPVYLLWRNKAGSGNYNFATGTNVNNGNVFEITPTTAADGTAYSTLGFRVDKGGRFAVSQNLPTVSALGTNVTSITLAGSDQVGLATVVIGAGGATAGEVLGTLTFSEPLVLTPQTVVCVDQTASSTLSKFTAASLGTASWQLVAQTALAAGTYTVWYHLL